MAYAIGEKAIFDAKTKEVLAVHSARECAYVGWFSEKQWQYRNRENGIGIATYRETLAPKRRKGWTVGSDYDFKFVRLKFRG